MWVRLPPGVPIKKCIGSSNWQNDSLQNCMMGVRIPPGTPNNVRMAERPNATVCKTVKPPVRIWLLTPVKEAWQSLVYCTGLENRRLRNRAVSSNLTASTKNGEVP